MRIVEMFLLLFSASFRKFLMQGICLKEKQEHLPPIRYEGDPTKIYLS